MNRCFPLPREVAEQAQGVQLCLNPALWLDHFTEWEKRDRELKRAEVSDKRQKIPKTFKDGELCNLITAYQKRWNEMLADYEAGGYRVKRLTLQAVTRVVIGLGAESVLETSIRLHRTYGFPIIPATALKGLARAYAKLVERKAENDPLLIELFGAASPEAQAGKVIFFDAIPMSCESIWLDLDVMNPHYAPYYQGSEHPADYHNPIPIFFLTIAPGSKFLFAMASKDEDLVSQAEEYLRKGLTELGIGAKTTAGYGLWEDFPADAAR